MAAILRLLVLICLATSSFSAICGDRDSQSYWYTVPPNSDWQLLGEWDYPDSEKAGLGVHRTTSIVKVGDIYLNVYSASLMGGCCLWPVGIRLEQRSELSFWDPASKSTYSIDKDGSLRVLNSDGSLQLYAPTPLSERFSDDWGEA